MRQRPDSYDRHVAKAGGLRGFDVVPEAPSRPFPEAVILRQTAPDARLELADHARAPFLGLSLGIEWDPARIRTTTRLGDVSMVHAARRHDRGRLHPAAADGAVHLTKIKARTARLDDDNS